jgi:hypothetical protein
MVITTKGFSLLLAAHCASLRLNLLLLMLLLMLLLLLLLLLQLVGQGFQYADVRPKTFVKGGLYKKFPRGRGRRHTIIWHTCHFSINLEKGRNGKRHKGKSRIHFVQNRNEA